MIFQACWSINGVTTMKSKKTICAIFILIIASLPLLPCFWWIITSHWDTNIFRDDIAVIELQVRKAQDFSQLLGPYSRFKWNHPGPFFFYLMAPFYTLLGEHSQALFIGVLALVFLSVAGTIMIATANGKWIQVELIACAFVLLTAYMEPWRLVLPWNPFATVFPFACFLFLNAGLILKGFRYFPWLIILGSFLIQTHIMYLPVCLTMIILSGLFRWLLKDADTDRNPDAGKRALTGFLIFIFLLSWFPPVYQQFAQKPGNLSLLCHFFSETRQHSSFEDMILPFAGSYSAPLISLIKNLVPSFSDDHNWGQGCLLIIQMMLLPLLTYRARLKGHLFDAAVGLSLINGTLVSLTSSSRITGEVHDYLILNVSVLGIFSTAAIIWMSGLSTHRLAVRYIPLLLMIGSSLYATRSIQVNARREYSVIASEISFVNPFAGDIIACCERNHISHPVFRIASDGVWGSSAAIILALEKRNLSYSIEDNWLFMFGYPHRRTGEEDGAFLFCSQLEANEMIAGDAYKLLRSSGEVCVLYSSITDE